MGTVRPVLSLVPASGLWPRRPAGALLDAHHAQCNRHSGSRTHGSAFCPLRLTRNAIVSGTTHAAPIGSVFRPVSSSSSSYE